MKAIRIGVLLALLVLGIIYSTEYFIERKIDSIMRAGIIALADEISVEYDKVYFNLLSFDLGMTDISFSWSGSGGEPLTIDKLVLFRFDTDRSHRVPHSMSIYIDRLSVPLTEESSGDFLLWFENAEIDRCTLTMYLSYVYNHSEDMLLLEAPSFRLNEFLEGRFRISLTKLPQSGDRLDILAALAGMEIGTVDMSISGQGDEGARFPSAKEIRITLGDTAGVTIGEILSVESADEFNAMGFSASWKDRIES